MSQIDSGQKHQATSFKVKGNLSSMAVMLTDSSPDAVWRLRVEVEVADGGVFMLGAVDTVAPNALAIRNPNRVVAIASIPGARNWRVFSELLAGTPTQNRSMVIAEMKLTECDDYASGCCPLVAIPGQSVNVNEGPSQTPTGAPPIGRVLRLFAGSGRALALDVAYLGNGLVASFAQQHDAAPADALSDATMVGIGWPFSLPATQTLTFRWSPEDQGRKFAKGYVVALSRAQNTYVLPPETETISAFGQWLPQ